jgi:DNA-binding transcriptional MerR regulator/effector-binding domain-containing protein
MFSIGEFSKATGLSIKTLRFYHEEGLLIPTSIDEATGYRYYDGSLVELARTIAFLKSLEFSLAEIREILGSEQDDAALVAALQRQRKVIDERIRNLKQVARSLDQFLVEQREGKKLMTSTEFQCEEKTLPPTKVAALRMHAPYSECGKGFSQLGKAFWSKSNGPPLMLCYDGEYQEIANYEVCFPVKGGQSTGQIEVRDLPGGRCVSLLHKGPYDQIGRSYAKAMAYAKDKGLALALPCREVYLKGPGMIFRGNPKNYLTEIQLLIEDGTTKP